MDEKNSKTEKALQGSQQLLQKKDNELSTLSERATQLASQLTEIKKDCKEELSALRRNKQEAAKEIMALTIKAEQLQGSLDTGNKKIEELKAKLKEAVTDKAKALKDLSDSSKKIGVHKKK